MLLQIGKFPFLWLSNIPLWDRYISHPLYSFICDVHLGCFHILTIVDNVAILNISLSQSYYLQIFSTIKLIVFLFHEWLLFLESSLIPLWEIPYWISQKLFWLTLKYIESKDFSITSLKQSWWSKHHVSYLDY